MSKIEKSSTNLGQGKYEYVLKIELVTKEIITQHCYNNNEELKINQLLSSFKTIHGCQVAYVFIQRDSYTRIAQKDIRKIRIESVTEQNQYQH